MPKKRAGETREHITRSEEETFSLARDLAVDFKGDEVVLLEGELGAGKTVFARGIAAGLGLKDLTQVCSPSYTLINVYPARVPIYHMDLYRLNRASEILDLGWEEYLGEGVIVVEWSERLDFDGKAVRIHIGVDEEGKRRITISR